MKHEDIDKWLDNRLSPGHHFNSQILIDFNKEVNKRWVEEVEKVGDNVSKGFISFDNTIEGGDILIHREDWEDIISQMEVSDELGK